MESKPSMLLKIHNQQTTGVVAHLKKGGSRRLC